MHEILFRGKRKKGDKRWVEGDLLHGYSGFVITNRYYAGSSFEVVPETVGQYTGLTDKNGNKIFEGDIVKAYDNYTGMTFIGVVKFGNGSFYICELHSNSHYRWNDYEVEVVGNIFENSELLEVEEHE